MKKHKEANQLKVLFLVSILLLGVIYIGNPIQVRAQSTTNGTSAQSKVLSRTAVNRIMARTRLPVPKNAISPSPLTSLEQGASVFNVDAVTLDVKVMRDGETIPLMGLPRLKARDTIKVKILAEGSNINNNSNWCLIVAFLDPAKPLTSSNKREVIQQVKLSENNQFYAEHQFRSPNYATQPIIFLIPNREYDNGIYDFLKSNSTAITQLGNAIVNISGAHSKLNKFVNSLQTILDSPPQSENEFKNNVLRLSNMFGTILPPNWETLGNTKENPNWREKLNFILEKSDPKKLESIIQIALDPGSFTETALALAVDIAQTQFPVIIPYVNLALQAIDIIKRIFFNRPDLQLIPTLVKPYYEGNTFQAIPNAVTLAVDRQISTGGTLTGIPFVPHLWTNSDEPDPILLRTPEISCFNSGVNSLQDQDLQKKWAADGFTHDFRLKVFDTVNTLIGTYNLIKNLGRNSWEVKLASNDMSLLRGAESLKAEINGKRGFTDMRSQNVFDIRIVKPQQWEISPETKNVFIKDGKIKKIRIFSQNGDCFCLQSISYTPSGRGAETQTFTPGNGLTISADNKFAEISLNTANLPAGSGQIEIKQIGETGTPEPLSLKLYPPLPNNLDFKIRIGDQAGILTGTDVEQIQEVKLNGKNTILKNREKGQLTVAYSDGLTQNEENVSLNITLEDNRAFSELVPGQSLSFEAEKARLTLKPESGTEFNAVFNMPQVSQFDFRNVSIVPVNTDQIKILVLHNMLDGYRFSRNQIASVSLKIIGSGDENYTLPRENLEVLADSELILTIPLNLKIGENDEPLSNLLARRRLQFQIEDRQRGISDWQTIKQTFVRLPIISKVECPFEENQPCTLSGQNFRFIKEISVDGGVTFPIQVSSIPNNQISINRLISKENLVIKLRDFDSVGLRLLDYEFVVNEPPTPTPETDGNR